MLDAVTARQVLARLGPHHRLALTLRYLDGLPVPEVARLLDRTLHATEALLVRARAAFRRAYDTPGTEATGDRPVRALREPVVPADPDLDFAAGLRTRLERALALPRGVVMTSTTVNETHTAEGAAIPYLAVPVGTGQRALDWYAEVLGARLAADPIMMPDGRVGHAELELAGGKLYLSEEFPEIGVVAPSPAGTPVSLSLRVPDVAETLRRAIDGGATMPRAMYDDYGSRNATVLDPFGHRWLLHTALAELPETDRQGDVGYAWLTVPDPDRAAEFYAAVLGWEYSPGYAPGGRNVVGQSLPMGLGRASPAGTCRTRWTTSRPRWPGSGPPAAPRPTRRTARTGPRPTAWTTRARSSPCTGPAPGRGRRRTGRGRVTCRT